MKKHLLLSMGLLVLLICTFYLFGSPTHARQHEPDSQIKKMLEDKISADPLLPGAIGAIQVKGNPLRIAAVGVRKFGDKTAIESDDLIHLGSCTKTMTATLIARLVDQGELNWDDKLAERLPKLAKQIHADYADVTLLQLVQHRGSIPVTAKDWWVRKGKSVRDHRANIAIESLQDKPAQPIGSKYVYSNLGYMIAGMFVESVTDSSWEQAIKNQLFRPLGITSAGFGPPGKAGKLTQPWGHTIKEERLNPVQHDNAPAMGPAATVHMTVEDWAKFAMLHVDGKLGEQQFIKSETLSLMQRAAKGQDYGIGWIVVPVGRGNTALSHSGSNTMWYCTIWVFPKNKSAVFAVTNVAGGDTPKKVNDLIVALMKMSR